MKTIAFNGMKTIYHNKLCKMGAMTNESRQLLKRVLKGEIKLNKSIRSELTSNIYENENKLLYYNKESSVFRNILNFIKINTKTFKVKKKTKNHFDMQVSPDNRYIAYNTSEGKIIILESMVIKHQTDHFIKNIEECLKYSFYHLFDPTNINRIVQNTDDWNFYQDNLGELLLKEQMETFPTSNELDKKNEINIHEIKTVKNFKNEENKSDISQNLMAKNAALLKYKNRERNRSEQNFNLKSKLNFSVRKKTDLIL
jgi:hypothetical protein